MPYIVQERRQPVIQDGPITAGELNFIISDVIDNYILDNEGVSYNRINEVIGVLECAKLELYRRIAAPYEDKKKEENGDVYTI